MRSRVIARAGFAVSAIAVLVACAEPVQPGDHPVQPPAAAAYDLQGVQLLRCPAPAAASTSGVIGPEGGTLKLKGHRLRVPAGAVLEPHRFTIHVESTEILKVDFRVDGHDHFRFRVPVSLTLSYDHCPAATLARSLLRVYYVDEATGAILEDLGGVLSPVENSITAETDHFSDYAVGSPH